MTRRCVICARGGSKGLPGKNIGSLVGKPLIAWTVEQAVDSGLFDVVAVSSEAHDVLALAPKADANLLVNRLG